jgi:YbbR domain-containing protein
MLALNKSSQELGEEDRNQMLQTRETTKERGGSKWNLIITLLIVGSMVFAGIKVVPVYVDNYQFQDAIESESKFALTGYPKKSIDDIRDDVWKKAQELSIPAQREDIQVNVTNGSVSISLDYSVPIDLAVYQLTLQFHPHADNHSI